MPHAGPLYHQLGRVVWLPIRFYFLSSSITSPNSKHRLIHTVIGPVSHQYSPSVFDDLSPIHRIHVAQISLQTWLQEPLECQWIHLCFRSRLWMSWRPWTSVQGQGSGFISSVTFMGLLSESPLPCAALRRVLAPPLRGGSIPSDFGAWPYEPFMHLYTCVPYVEPKFASPQHYQMLLMIRSFYSLSIVVFLLWAD